MARQFVVLLYNDRDQDLVREISNELKSKWANTDFTTWFAADNLTAFGNLFVQIEKKIQDAVGVVIFLGSSGLGKFQQNIEMGAIQTCVWQEGAKFGVLVALLHGDEIVPSSLLGFPSVNYNGRVQGCKDMSDAISRMFGISPAAGVGS